MNKTAPIAFVLLLAGCGRQKVVEARVDPSGHENPLPHHQVRATGKVRAVRSYAIQVPQIIGQNSSRLTLIKLAANGAEVREGDVVAEFDGTQEAENARQAQARYDDFSHQVEQKQAQNRADAEKRSSDLQKAEADLAKARIELRKGPILSEIDRLKNEAKAQDAQAHVDSLKQSSQFHDQADAAALRILELQRDRQKVALDRAKNNAEKLVLHAPVSGRVSLESVWRNGSMGHAQEGDQLWWGQALLRVFDPSAMELQVQVGEPDGGVLVPGAKATVSLDAYPDLVFTANFEAASPVATSAMGSPIKSFIARFRFESSDPHILPDLSAALAIALPGTKGGPN
jgi:HlyD family secretion protein